MILTTLYMIILKLSIWLLFHKLITALWTLTPRLTQYLAEHTDALEDAEEDEHPREHRGANHWPPEPRQLRHAPRQLQNVLTAGKTRKLS